MNPKYAFASENNSLDIEKIAFKNIPGQSRLFIDFQAGSADVRKFYPEKLSESLIEKVLANFKTDRNAVCNILEETNKTFGASEKTLENINLLRKEDCVAIVTGQQAGLFTGAIYTIYKALSAVKLAENLRKKNINAVPVFWIAEEDHDFDEVKKTFAINKTGKLFAVENTPRDYQKNLPVGDVIFDETIKKTVAELLDNLAQTEFTGELQNLLAETYREKETYSTSFAKFTAKLFAAYGLIIFSPLNEKLKKLAAPIFAESINKSDQIRAALLNRTKQLEAENYQAQVLVEEDFFPFFYIEENGERLALKKTKNGKVKVKNSKKEFSIAELVKIAEKSPETLSPNVLMRPIVQDFLLPTAVYFGGAAEIAYFAQNEEIYRILNRPVTPLRHRASFTIVETKNRRTLKKYQLKLADLFAGREKLFARVVNEFLANDAAREFAEVEQVIAAQLDRLDKTLSAVEPTLSTNLDGRRRKISYHIDALLKKFQRAEIQKNDTARRRIEFLLTSLLPHKALQERTLNVTCFFNLYGENFIDWIYQAINTEEKEHQIFYL